MVDFDAAVQFAEDLRIYCSNLIDVAKIKICESKQERENLVRLIVENSTIKEEDLVVSSSAGNENEMAAGITDFDSAMRFLEDLKEYFNTLTENTKKQIQETKGERDQLFQLLEQLRNETQGMPLFLGGIGMTSAAFRLEQRQGVAPLGYWEDPPFEDNKKPVSGSVSLKLLNRYKDALSLNREASLNSIRDSSLGNSERDTGWESGWETGWKREQAPAEMTEFIYEPQGPGVPDAEAIKKRYIVGKVAGKHLVDHRGAIIAERGAVITEETVRKAEEEGKLVELILNMTWKKE